VLDRFSENCRKGLVAAEREARRLGHRQIATEHVLLGLLRVEGSCAARGLRLMGVSYAKARRRVTALVDAGPGRVEGPLAFTPRVREILEDAFTGAVWSHRLGEALTGPSFEPSSSTPWDTPISAGAPRLSTGCGKVSTENVLLALIANGDGVAAHVLADLGVTLEKAAVATTEARFPRPERSTLRMPFRATDTWPPSPPAKN
jgi:ATP-dependent Clp protease ATP-binding subunit ClpC